MLVFFNSTSLNLRAFAYGRSVVGNPSLLLLELSIPMGIKRFVESIEIHYTAVLCMRICVVL